MVWWGIQIEGDRDRWCSRCWTWMTSWLIQRDMTDQLRSTKLTNKPIRQTCCWALEFLIPSSSTKVVVVERSQHSTCWIPTASSFSLSRDRSICSALLIFLKQREAVEAPYVLSNESIERQLLFKLQLFKFFFFAFYSCSVCVCIPLCLKTNLSSSVLLNFLVVLDECR